MFRNIYGSSPHLLEGLDPTSAGKSQGNLLDFHRLGSQSLEGRGSRPLREFRSLPDLAPSAGSLDLPARPLSLPERSSPSVESLGGTRSGDHVIIEMIPRSELPPEGHTNHQDDTPVDSPDLGINTDRLFKALGITEDPQRQREVLDIFANMKRDMEELTYMGDTPLRPNEGIARLDTINEVFLAMSDQLKSEQDITAMRRYYYEFVRHANTWYGQAIVGSLIGAANDIYPSLLSKGWLWSTFILGGIAAGFGGMAVRKFGFPFNVFAQTAGGQAIIIGGGFVEKYVKAKYKLP
ncbi:hypothetical protein KSF_093490 [Reticulibacter mediterranei]|uniref:Uncharacterized protein n=1 Tax=Reticulibacter mediterranei TaxID=2778369 RepID=A0A8J3J0D8_9CHLR|nr:hypothetical protein KSF_093490 [Reticulibacter mediterranei]